MLQQILNNLKIQSKLKKLNYTNITQGLYSRNSASYSLKPLVMIYNQTVKFTTYKIKTEK